jgi:predicted phage terminase large subunit-like protein
LWPQRFPVEFLEQFQKNRYDWASIFQQRPKPKGGNIINRVWFKIVEKMPPGAKIVRFWDLAGTPKEEKKKNDPDFTAGGLVGYKDNTLYVVDVKTSRDTPLNIEKMIKQTAVLDDNQYGKVRQYWEEEPGAGGKHITDHYRKLLAAHWRQEYRTGKNKEFYIDLLANKAQAGEVCLVQGKWLHEIHDENTFLDEAEEFPKGRHDDRIDAVAKAVYVLTGKPLTMAEAIKQAKQNAGKGAKQTEFYQRFIK